MKIIKLLVILPLMICLLYACEKNGSDRDHEFEEKEYKTISLSNQTMLILENTNGNIIITGTDTANNMYLDITKKVKSRISVSDAQSHISDISISTQEKPDEIRRR